jgi:hypothetical protein
MDMGCPIIIRRHEGVQSYLVLDDNPRELLRHVGFADQFSVRPWLGSLDPQDALTEWAEMLAEDPDNYMIAEEDHRDYSLDRLDWDHCQMWPPKS